MPLFTQGLDPDGSPSGAVAYRSVNLATAPTALTISTDTIYIFGYKVRHLLVQNNSGTAVGVGLDAIATAGSLQVAAGATLALDVPVTSVHLFSAAATAVNGTSAANIVLMGWQ